MPVLSFAGSELSRLLYEMQVHGGDQSPLPPLWNSFVGTGIHNGPVPPAVKLEVLHLFRCSTHTPHRSREVKGGAQLRPRQ